MKYSPELNYIAKKGKIFNISFPVVFLSVLYGLIIDERKLSLAHLVKACHCLQMWC